jgi:hypothetical protein
LYWKQQQPQLSWGKDERSKSLKTNPFHLFIHPFIAKTLFVVAICAPYEVFSDECGQKKTILHLSAMIVVKNKTWSLVKFY